MCSPKYRFKISQRWQEYQGDSTWKFKKVSGKFGKEITETFMTHPC